MIAYDGRMLVDRFNELVIPGERIGIIGPNGIGKTTLLNALAGRHTPDGRRYYDRTDGQNRLLYSGS